VQAIRVEDIDQGGAAAYGVEVLPPGAADGRAELVDEWSAWARERYGSEIVARELTIDAKPPLLNFVEVHPNSAQLTISFREPWILSVIPGWTSVESFDPAAVRSFVVAPGTAVLIPPGLWHGPLTPLDRTEALVVFREDVRDEWTELPNPVPLVIDRASV
jgi:ureidoglycolate lyase